MIFGIILLIIGVCYLLTFINPALSIDFDVVWPILFIVLGLYNLIKNKNCDSFSIIIVFTGFWFLVYNLNFIPYELKNAFWPLIIILIGCIIIYKSISFKKKTDQVKKNIKKAISYTGIFGGCEEIIKNQDFEGAEAYAVFGGVDLDLRPLKNKKDIIINAYSVFGGITLLMPENYNVIVSSNSIFGATDNKVKNTYKDSNPNIYVNATTVFGGIEIK